MRSGMVVAVAAVLLGTGCTAAGPQARDAASVQPSSSRSAEVRVGKAGASASASSVASSASSPKGAPSPTPSSTTPADETLRPITKPVDGRTGQQRNRPFTVNGIELVSTRYPVASGFRPKVTGSAPMTPEAAKAFAKLRKAIERAGLRVFVVSAYRSHAAQEALYAHSLATMGRTYTTRYVAVPGTSEHQTGLAVDLRSPSGRGTTFNRTKEWRWLRSHAQDYGFVLRYPKGLTKVTGIWFEPWHWRYVGVEQARAIRALGPEMTIEQYLRLA